MNRLLVHRQRLSQNLFPDASLVCITMLAASIGLLGASLIAYNFREVLATSLVLLFLRIERSRVPDFFSLWHLRREHHETDQAFRNTDCEFLQFRHVLDGI